MNLLQDASTVWIPYIKEQNITESNHCLHEWCNKKRRRWQKSSWTIPTSTNQLSDLLSIFASLRTELQIDLCFKLMRTVLPVCRRAVNKGASKRRNITVHLYCLDQQIISHVIASLLPAPLIIAAKTSLEYQTNLNITEAKAKADKSDRQFLDDESFHRIILRVVQSKIMASAHLRLTKCRIHAFRYGRIIR